MLVYVCRGRVHLWHRRSLSKRRVYPRRNHKRWRRRRNNNRGRCDIEPWYSYRHHPWRSTIITPHSRHHMRLKLLGLLGLFPGNVRHLWDDFLFFEIGFIFLEFLHRFRFRLCDFAIKELFYVAVHGTSAWCVCKVFV